VKPIEVKVRPSEVAFLKSEVTRLREELGAHQNMVSEATTERQILFDR